jgi:putative transposase
MPGPGSAHQANRGVEGWGLGGQAGVGEVDDTAASVRGRIHYKARWQIELFFKWIKQNLKIKSFLGTSRNAVMTQIWIAICVYLLLAYLKFASRIGQSFQQILRLLQLNLFERRRLRSLLCGDPPEPQSQPLQIALRFS